jgi:sigma-E factor negative regulatory protein RseC
MTRLGYVVKTHGDRAVISTSRRGVCDGCSEKSSCAFDKALGKDEPVEVEAVNTARALPGDFVEFDLEGHTELKVSLLVWVVPLLGIIAGAVLGTACSDAGDIATLIGAAVGFILAFAIVIFVDRRSRDDPRLTPHILKVIKPTSCPDQ